MDFTNIVIPAITGFLTFLLGQHKGKKEIESITLSNLEKSIQIYQVIVSDLKGEIIALNAKIDVLQNKVDEMMVENHQLKMMMSEKKV